MPSIFRLHCLLLFYLEWGWGEETGVRVRKVLHSRNLLLAPSRLDRFPMLIVSHSAFLHTLQTLPTLGMPNLKNHIVGSYWLLYLAICASLGPWFWQKFSPWLNSNQAPVSPFLTRPQPWPIKTWTNTNIVSKSSRPHPQDNPSPRKVSAWENAMLPKEQFVSASTWR